MKFLLDLRLRLMHRVIYIYISVNEVGSKILSILNTFQLWTSTIIFLVIPGLSNTSLDLKHFNSS